MKGDRRVDPASYEALAAFHFSLFTFHRPDCPSPQGMPDLLTPEFWLLAPSLKFPATFLIFFGK
jgi:hypothetical protein